MVTLPMDSKLCAWYLEMAYKWKPEPPDKRALGLVPWTFHCLEAHANYLCNRTKW